MNPIEEIQMSAQPQTKQDQPSRHTQPILQSTETRLAIVETHWQDIIPILATKEDVLRSEQKATSAIADLKNETTAIRALQEAHLHMIEGLKSGQGRIESSLDDIHQLQGKFNYELGKIGSKTNTQEELAKKDREALEQRVLSKMDAMGELAKKDREALEQRFLSKIDAMGKDMEAQTNKIIVRLGSLFIVILGAIEVVSRLWPKV